MKRKRTRLYRPGDAAQFFLATYGSAFNDEMMMLIRPALYRLLADAYEAGINEGLREREEVLYEPGPEVNR